MDTIAKKKAPPRKRKRALKEPPRARFDRIFKNRVKADTGREDPVKWLSEVSRVGYSTVSHQLCGTMPRRNSIGQAYLTWQRICKHLTKEEIKLLES